MENLTFDALFGADPPPGAASLPVMLPGLGRACCNSHAMALKGQGGPFCRAAVPPGLARWYVDLAGVGRLMTHLFSSVRGPSTPNHLMLMCAQTPFVSDVPPRDIPALPSIVDRLEERHFTWRAYSGRADGGLALLPQLRHRAEQRPWTAFLADAAADRLPHLSWVIPPFTLSQHAPAPWLWGTAFLSQVLAAWAASPAWAESLLLVLWDDWGGYADHVAPPVVERWRDGTPLSNGFRVPAYVFSPEVAAGFDDTPAAGLSFLKLIEQIWGLEPLTWRDAGAPSLLGLLSGRPQGPRPQIPALPLPPGLLQQVGDRLAHLGSQVT